VPAERYGPDDSAAARDDAESILAAVDEAWRALEADGGPE